jgi:hypothetical protein
MPQVVYTNCATTLLHCACKFCTHTHPDTPLVPREAIGGGSKARERLAFSHRATPLRPPKQWREGSSFPRKTAKSGVWEQHLAEGGRGGGARSRPIARARCGLGRPARSAFFLCRNDWIVRRRLGNRGRFGLIEMELYLVAPSRYVSGG